MLMQKLGSVVGRLGDDWQNPSIGLLSRKSRSSMAKEYNLQGETASGAPLYKAVASDLHIYFDPSCDGTTTDSRPTLACGNIGCCTDRFCRFNRWIISHLSGTPDRSLANDLDGDAACNAVAYISSTSTVAPPQGSWALTLHRLVSRHVRPSQVLPGPWTVAAPRKAWSWPLRRQWPCDKISSTKRSRVQVDRSGQQPLVRTRKAEGQPTADTLQTSPSMKPHSVLGETRIAPAFFCAYSCEDRGKVPVF